MGLLWQTETEQVEKDFTYEQTQTHICYLKNGSFDFEYIGTGDELEFSKPVDWLSVKQQFFATALLAKNKFSSAGINWSVPKDTSGHYIARSVANAKIKLSATGTGDHYNFIMAPVITIS